MTAAAKPAESVAGVPEVSRVRDVAALYVQTGGCYFGLDGVDPWDEKRDARLYAGPHPVVAHPPCQLWVNFAALNHKRWGGEHNRPGSDGGCFLAALTAIRRFGGVLEHPANSNAWGHHGLTAPDGLGWGNVIGLDRREWTCEVWQSAYGHLARKRTWLYYVGRNPPPSLDWSRPDGTHQIGKFDRNKPTIQGKAASATPLAFRDMLLEIARAAP